MSSPTHKKKGGKKKTLDGIKNWKLNKTCQVGGQGPGLGPILVGGQYSSLGTDSVQGSESWFLGHLQQCSVCDPEKIFFTSKFSYVLFSNPTHKTETQTTKRWGTTNDSKPPGSIIMTDQSETLSISQIIFITLFSAGTQSCCALYQPHHSVQLCGTKTIFLSQTGTCWIFFIQFFFTYPAQLKMLLVCVQFSLFCFVKYQHTLRRQ